MLHPHAKMLRMKSCVKQFGALLTFMEAQQPLYLSLVTSTLQLT
jgi:hypothetical protein